MNHDFEVLEKAEYHAATPTKLSEMRIGEDLLIGSEDFQEAPLNTGNDLENKIEKEDEGDDNQFWFKLKL